MKTINLSGCSLFSVFGSCALIPSSLSFVINCRVLLYGYHEAYVKHRCVYKRNHLFWFYWLASRTRYFSSALLGNGKLFQTFPMYTWFHTSCYPLRVDLIRLPVFF